MRKIVGFEPSSAFMNNELGDVIELGGRLYCLVNRDPWRAYCVRYYWFDYLVGRLYERLGGK